MQIGALSMLGLLNLIRRTIEGSIVAIVLIGVVAVFGVSQTINVLLAERSVAAILFLLALAIVLADLIGKFIGIVSSTFPDLIPKVEDEDLKRASLIERLRPGQTLALLSGAHLARVAMFLVIFALLGASYAAAPNQAQQTLFGDFRALEATETFLREGVAGSFGYFLFFLGPDNLKPVTDMIVTEPLSPATTDGDVFLVGIRLYGLAFVLSMLRVPATPLTYLRARGRARKLPTQQEPAAEAAA